MISSASQASQRNSTQLGDLSQAELLEGLRAGIRTVLPNARAARALRAAYDTEQEKRGLRAWASAPALSWSEWTHELWTALLTAGSESRVLLNTAQEHQLWRDLIRDSVRERLQGPTRERIQEPIQDQLRETAPEHLPGVDTLAELAHSAWSLAAAWGITQRLRGAANTHDTRTFAAWSEDFARRCSADGFLPQAALEEALSDHLRSSHVPAPAELRFVGFTEFLPAQLRLLNGSRDLGSNLGTVFCKKLAFSQGSSPTASAHTGALDTAAGRFLTIAPTEREELLLAAQWVRSRVKGAQRAGKALRLGILLPSSGVDRAELDAVLREVLAPELEANSADLSSQPWAFAQGEPLNGIALLADLMKLAQLCSGPLSLEGATSLLLSPYLGSSADLEANARFDAYTLRPSPRLRAEITLRELASLTAADARNHPEQHAPAPWLQAVADFAARALDPKLRRSFAEWTEVLRRLAAAAGWPGDRQLSAREFEGSRAWESALDVVATLDFSGERVGFEEVLEALERQLADAAFTPPEVGSSIEILTPEQALGSPFDVLVCLRGHDENWPRPARLHPLLAAGLQRELAMPGADPGRERRLLEALWDGTPLILATCAAENADGRLRVSPLFAELGFLPLPAPNRAVQASLEPQVEEEVLPDDAVLPSLPSPEVRGGARVLQLQAACGFLAFAAMRLGSTELEARDAGFDARENGTLLHRSLEQFWKRIRTQADLRALSPEDRRRTLNDCIDAAVSQRLTLQSDWDRAYLGLQKIRLSRLLEQWMDHELQRGAFRIADSEREERIAVGPLALKVRIDRIDEVEGGVVLVDYKSGISADTKSWEGDRPDEPQLPLYALRSAPETVQGVAFARVRSGNTMRWAGLAAASGILPRAESRTAAQNFPDLQEHIAQWRTDLTRLAEDFFAGQTAVSPKSFTQNCSRCAQRLLCRLDPASLRPEFYNEADAESANQSREQADDEANDGEAFYG